MSGDVWGEVVEQTRLLMRSTKQLAHRHYEIYEGLGPTLGGMLGLLARERPMRLTELADRLQVDVSVASRQATELVQRGLVIRRPDPADARAGLLEASDDGKAVVERAERRRVDVLTAALGDWNEHDVQELVTLLTKLNADLRRAACGNDTLPAPDAHHDVQRSAS